MHTLIKYREYINCKPDNATTFSRSCYLYETFIFGVGERPQMQVWHSKMGPIYRIKMGVKPWIIIGDPYIANDILKVKGAITAGRPFHLYMSHYGALDERGLVFTYPDKRWKSCRAIAQGLLSPKAVADKVEMMQSEAAKITELILKGTKESGYVDVFKSMQLATLNIIMQTCFGIRAKSLDDPLAHTMFDLIDTSIKLSAPDQDMQTFLPALSGLLRLFTSSENTMRDFVYKKRNPEFWRLIQEARENDSDCFVKNIYRLKEENGLEDDDILVFMVDMIEAATDTTAITLSWSFLILSHYPDVQLKVQNEIDTFITKHNRLPVYEERENFPFMLSVQKESMRYRAVIPMNLPHEVTKDFEYNGYLIPKGTAILASTYTLNLSEEFYDNPREFIPERYLYDKRPLSVSVNANSQTRDQFVFGWGRRICPGVHMSDVELFNFWVRILATARIEPPLLNGQPVYPDLNAYHDGGLTVGPSETKLRFVERHDRLI
ncbi:cytochrome P450 [Zychaea mexicana]|uniref:cytochrome P450 n=1 Tax=Zychaea mexicana TaxID=64656 RepID=UPI0022FE682F|nr:cytochrome P450 [Zychaea mexicana]KAI9493967.1 cytochrome P450 [Zychaea mexicana]